MPSCSSVFGKLSGCRSQMRNSENARTSWGRAAVPLILPTGEQFKLAEGQWPDRSPMDLPPLP